MAMGLAGCARGDSDGTRANLPRSLERVVPGEAKFGRVGALRAQMDTSWSPFHGSGTRERQPKTTRARGFKR